MFQRLVTGLILGPAALAAVWFVPNQWVALALALVWMLGAWEWSGFASTLSTAARAGYVALVAAGMAAMWFVGLEHLQFVYLIAGTWWAAASLWILRYPAGFPESDDRVAMKMICGLLVLLPSWLALTQLHAFVPNGTALLYLFVLIWGADVGAYFAGKSLGRIKLAPRVSPGKTWEGVGGAIAMGVVLAIAGAMYFGFQNARFAAFVLMSLLVIAISIVGDLTQSMFKRHSGLKDSGVIFPGHGGVLDRLDSSMAAGPLFMIGMMLSANLLDSA